MNDEEFITLTPDEDVEFDEVCEDDTEELLRRYDSCHKRRIDDIPAMQAVLCVILAAGLFVLNLTKPEICSDLFSILTEQTSSADEIMQNPIDWFIERL